MRVTDSIRLTPLLASLLLGSIVVWWFWPHDANRPIPKPPDAKSLDPLVAAAIHDAIAELDASPRNRDAWMLLGMTYEANGLPQLAKTCYANAAELDEPDARILHRLALMQHAHWKQEAALNTMAQARELHASYAPLYWRPALWLLDEGRIDDAENLLHAAIEIDRDDPASWFVLARLRIAQGRADEVTELLEGPLQRGRYADYSRHLLRQAYWQVGRYDDAAALDVADPTEPSWRDPWGERVYAYRAGRTHVVSVAQQRLAQGAYAHAASIAERALQHDPSNAELFNIHAVALIGMNRPREAVVSLMRATQHAPESESAWLNLARAAVDTGQIEQANVALDKVFSLNPDSEDAKRLRDHAASMRSGSRERTR